VAVCEKNDTPFAFISPIVELLKELDFSRPGKPTDNAKVESFNGRFRQECLNAHWFLSLDDARRKIDGWRRYYNEVHPHSALQCGDTGGIRPSGKGKVLSGTSTDVGNFYFRPVLIPRYGHFNRGLDVGFGLIQGAGQNL
jgi:hypothetical protein